MSNSSSPKKKVTWGDIFTALSHRKSAAMFVLGMASGLPYVLITGTILAWFNQEGISVKTIGIFSWSSILLGFKFLWSPAIDRAAFPSFFGMGQRRAGIFLLQGVIIATLTYIAFSNPSDGLLSIAIACVVCTIAFASQDILIDAWRIEVADEVQTLDVLSALYQIGNRISGILGGAGALMMAARIGWQNSFLMLTGLMVILVAGVFIAMDSPIQRRKTEVGDDAPPAHWRNWVVLPTMLAWAGSVTALLWFMSFALENPDQANARTFTRSAGPIIIFVSVLLPTVLSGILLYFHQRAANPTSPASEPSSKPWPAQSGFDAMYGSVVRPLMDFAERLGLGAFLVLGVAVTYRFVDLSWGAFAYPFYLGDKHGALGHTLDEVAIASKVFGTLMTTFGVIIGGLIILRIGRMLSLFIGGILAAATNILFADLALGGQSTHAVLSALHLYTPFQFVFQPLADYLSLDVTVNEKLVQLMVVIAAENLAVGFASASIVVYLTSIANPKYAAVQYALLASLSMLIGTLGRAWLGELVEERGFAYVFYLTAALGSVAVVLVALEWVRQVRSRSQPLEGKSHSDIPAEQ